MKYNGEWEARDSRGQPFPSGKALREYVAAGGIVHLENLAIYGNHAGMRLLSTDLKEGDTLGVIYGPCPSRGVPNKWYQSLVVKGGKVSVPK